MNSFWLLLALLGIILGVTLWFVFVLYKNKKDKKLSLLGELGFACIIAGIMFGDDIYIKYSFIAAGLSLMVVFVVLRRRKNPGSN